jgi:hypothetical protein
MAQVLGEMRGFALAIVGLVALIGVLAPFLNYFSGLQKLQFGNSAILNFLVSFCTLGILLLSFDDRHNLYLYWPFWLFFAGGILLLAILSVGVDYLQSTRVPDPKTGQPTWTWYEAAVGGTIYVVAIGLMFFSLNKATAEMAYFQPIEGSVAMDAGESRRLVRLVYKNPGEYAEAYTDKNGMFRFLITPKEASDTTQLCVFKKSSGDGWVLASSNPLINEYGCTGERGCKLDKISDQQTPKACNKR